MLHLVLFRDYLLRRRAPVAAGFLVASVRYERPVGHDAH